LRFEELPEIPPIWLDFLNSKLPFLPAVYEMQMLSDRARDIHSRMTEAGKIQILSDARASFFAQMPDNMQRLHQSGSVAVIAQLQPGLLGGPISQILKCLTAIRICEELAKQGIAAVPIGWINTDVPLDFPTGIIHLLDGESGLHCLTLGRSETIDIGVNDPLPQNQVEELLSQIRDLGQGTFDIETIEIIQSTFVPGSSLSSASANLLAALMKEWEMIFVDAAAPSIQSILSQARATLPIRAENPVLEWMVPSLVMPVMACVVDPYEIQTYAHMLPIFDELDLPKPMAWPQVSATILDARSRRFLDRLKLNLGRLYSGEEAIAGRIRDALPRSASDQLDNLKRDVEMTMAEVDTLSPAGSEFAKTANACREKIVYQLQKLRNHCVDAANRQETVMRRQIHKLCNSLAPNRRMQERELGGIQIPLRYSRAGLRSLYEKLDILNLEHQLISMD
jgi:uncharacterized protein YllA (UPF0747 family)